MEKEIIYPKRIRGDPDKPTLLVDPPSPEHQQTTCHNDFPSASNMVRQHSDTKKVAHATHSLKLCFTQKYLPFLRVTLTAVLKHVP